MYVRIGVEVKTVEDLWTGKHQCDKCGRECDFHLFKDKQVTSVFGIPFMSITQKRYMKCDKCGAVKELKAKKYKELRQKHYLLLQLGEYPDRIVEKDCNPKKLKMGRRLLKLIASGALSAMFPIIFIDMIIETGLHNWKTSDCLGFLFMLIVWGICSIPFIISLKKYLLGKKMDDAYEKMEDRDEEK